MYSSERLAHGIPYSSIFKLVSMIMQKLLTSALVSDLVLSMTKDSANPMFLANDFKANRTLDSFSIGQT